MKAERRTKTQLVRELRSLRATMTHLKKSEETLKIANASLRDSKDCYQAIVDNSDDAILLTEPDGRNVSANPAACRMFGTTKAEMRRLGRSRVVDTRDPRLPKAFEEIKRTGKFKGELNCLRKDGSVFPAQVSTTVFGNSEGMEWTSLIIRDISGRKRAETDSKWPLEWQEAIFEGSRDAIFVADFQGRFVAVNNAACNLTAYTREDLLKMQIPDLHEEEDRAAYNQFRDRIMAGEPILSEARIRRKDGTKVHAEFSNSRVIIAGKSYMHTTARDITERRRAEEEIRRSALLLDTAPNSITVHDPNGRFLYANQKTFDLHGFTRDEFLALNLHQLDVPDSEELIAVRMKELLDRGEATFQVAHYRKDGGTLPLEVHVSISTWDDKEVILSIATDITERKRVEESLRESAMNLAASQRIGKLGSWDWDVAQNSLSWSDEVYRIWGIGKDFDLNFDSIAGMIHPDDRELNSTKVEECLCARNKGDFEFRIICPDGIIKYIYQSIEVTRAPSGQPIRMIGIMQDITERKRAEEALHESEERFRSLSSLASEGVMVHQDGVILDANMAFAKLLGYGDPEEIIGKDGMELLLFTPDSEKIVRAHLRSGTTESYDVDLINTSGRITPAETCGRHITYRGRPARLVRMRDITERKRVEKEIERRTEDLSLLKALNAAANRGESLQKIIALLAEQAKSMFSSTGITVYLPSEDKQYLVVQNFLIREDQVHWIEQLIGMRIPEVRIALREESIYRQIVLEGKPKLINDPETIQSMIAEFTENKTLKKLVPAIFQFLGIHSVITIPFFAGDELIGMMDISRIIPFTETEMERITVVAEEFSAIVLRKRAEEEVKRSHDELSRLNRHLNTIREEERIRVSREIHDELGQSLTTVKIDLSLLESKLTPNQTDLASRCQSMQVLVDRTITTVQRIASQLRPGLLDDLGLGAAIEWQSQEFQKHTEIECGTNITAIADMLGREKQVEIFRMFQEVLTNVARHSKATKVDVCSSAKGDSFILQINDNGIGVDPGKIIDIGSLGFLGMRERAKSVGGFVSIAGSPGRGTSVTIVVPLGEEVPSSGSDTSKEDTV